MKLSIVYHVYKNHSNLEASLKSLFVQTDPNFELILVNDGASKNVNMVLNKLDFSKLKHVTYYSFSQNRGHSFSYNNALKNVDSDYIYYSGSNIIFNNNFVKTINDIISTNKDVDVLSWVNVYNDSKNMSYVQTSAQFKCNISHSMNDKIVSITLLKAYNINLNEEKYYPLVFIYQVLSHFHKWIIVDKIMSTAMPNKNYTYNLYDIFDQNNYLLDKYRNTKFWKDNNDLFEYFMIMAVIHNFVIRIFRTYSNKRIRATALDKAKSWLETNIPNWKYNKILNAKHNMLSPSKVHSLKKFKFRPLYVVKMMKECAI